LENLFNWYNQLMFENQTINANDNTNLLVLLHHQVGKHFSRSKALPSTSLVRMRTAISSIPFPLNHLPLPSISTSNLSLMSSRLPQMALAAR
jgi:hypothetical protein